MLTGVLLGSKKRGRKNKSTEILRSGNVSSVVSYSLQPHGLWPTRLLCPWDFSDKNTGEGYHFLFQGRKRGGLSFLAMLLVKQPIVGKNFPTIDLSLLMMGLCPEKPLKVKSILGKEKNLHLILLTYLKHAQNIRD